ncbi:hypothetical protein AM593_04459, partial [Mytilus galloprovincialis]
MEYVHLEAVRRVSMVNHVTKTDRQSANICILKLRGLNTLVVDHAVTRSVELINIVMQMAAIGMLTFCRVGKWTNGTYHAYSCHAWAPVTICMPYANKTTRLSDEMVNLNDVVLVTQKCTIIARYISECNSACEDGHFGKNCTEKCNCLTGTCDISTGICGDEFQIKSEETFNVAAIVGSVAAFIIVVLIVVAVLIFYNSTINKACVEGDMPDIIC